MRAKIARKVFFSLLLAGVGLALLPACSPLYVLRVGYEEARILWSRRPITTVLRRPDLATQTREKLELVLRVRRFASTELAFDVGGSYSSLAEIADPPILYVLSAAPRTSLEPYTWWFPVVGRVGYKGYFDEARARREARRLADDGYDTYIRTAAAFSTLGWFADPLLPHLLEYDREQLATTVLHELFHNTFYLSGQTAFNESLANFAGHRGAIAFFAADQRGTARLVQQAEAAWQYQLAVSECFAAAAARLHGVYSSELGDLEKLAQRAQIFSELHDELRHLPGAPAAASEGTVPVDLNNAVILHYRAYLTDLAVFDRIYRENGADLRRSLALIMSRAEQNKAQPFFAIQGPQHRRAAGRRPARRALAWLGRSAAGDGAL